MMELKKLDVVSVGKVFALFGAIFGLIAGFIMTLVSVSISSLISSMAPLTTGMPVDPMAFAGIGALAIVIFPIMYAIGGFLSGVISAFIYNIVAGKFGGIEVDLQNTQAVSQSPNTAAK